MSFVGTVRWLLRPGGAFVRAFEPEELRGDHRASAYMANRLCDMVVHRLQQGKAHDHVRFVETLQFHGLVVEFLLLTLHCHPVIRASSKR